ncbi:hypothetical protein BH10ACI1_BH10ACI1_29140 [soil metagenome]
MAITSATKVIFIMFLDDGTPQGKQLGYLELEKGVTFQQLTWKTYTLALKPDDWGFGRQEGNNCVLCPSQNPSQEHKSSTHTKDCSVLYDFSFNGFDTAQVHRIDVKTRVTNPFQALCKINL